MHFRNFDPTRPDPTRGSTRPVSISDFCCCWATVHCCARRLWTVSSHLLKVKGAYSSSLTDLRATGRQSLAIWDHTVLPATRHKWTRPALTPANTGWYWIYIPRIRGRLSWAKWLVTCGDDLPVRRQSLVPALDWPGVKYLRSSRPSSDTAQPPVTPTTVLHGNIILSLFPPFRPNFPHSSPTSPPQYSAYTFSFHPVLTKPKLYLHARCKLL